MKGLSRKIGVVIILLLIGTLCLDSVLWAAPRDLNPQEKTRIQAAIEFLNDNGETEWAYDVAQWLKEGRIKVDPHMSPRTNATTSRDGTITIRGALLASLTQAEAASDQETWKKNLDLARLLIHEKVHAHYQAPGSPTFEANGHQAGDWEDTAHAFRHCRGPEATEMEAYYKFILVLFTWYKDLSTQEQQVSSQLNSDTLTPEERQRLQQTRADLLARQTFLSRLIQQWVDALKSHNYEKGSYLADSFRQIDEEQGSETDKLARKINELKRRIAGLFGEDGPYNRARQAVREATRKAVRVSAADGKTGFTEGIVVLPFQSDTMAQGSDVELRLYDPYPLPPEGFEPVLLAGTETPAFGTSSSEHQYIRVLLHTLRPGCQDLAVYGYGANKPPQWERIPAQSLSADDGTIQATLPTNGIFMVLVGTGEPQEEEVTDPVADHIPLETVIIEENVPDEEATSDQMPDDSVPETFFSTLTIGSHTYSVNDQVYEMDAPPYIKSNRTYVPVRYLAYAIGLKNDQIAWNGKTQTAVLTDGLTRVELTIGAAKIKINEEWFGMDIAPEIHNNRTMLPARFVAEAFGAEVGWNAATGSVIVKRY